MITIYYIDTKDLKVTTADVDNRLTKSELDATYGLWFYDEESASTELDVLLYNLDQ